MGFTRQDLVFRELDLPDLDMLRAWRNDFRMSSGWHDPVSIQTWEQQQKWYDSLGPEHQAFLVQPTKDSFPDAIGLLRFRLDPIHQRAALIGTDVAPHMQGKGYGKRILRAGAEHILLDLGYHRVTAEAMDTNIAAQKIIQSCGFKHEGEYRDYVWRNGEWHDWNIYSLLAGELK